MKEHTEAPTCHQTTHPAEELAAVYKHGEQQEKHPAATTHIYAGVKRETCGCLKTQKAQTLLFELLLKTQKIPLVTSGNKGENSGKWRYGFLRAVLSPDNPTLVGDYKAILYPACWYHGDALSGPQIKWHMSQRYQQSNTF